MKKTLFILALVALVIGSVYGGTVIAAPPARTSGPVIMNTLSGSGTVSDTTGYIVQRTYTGVRHVSLTVCCLGIETGDDVDVAVSMFGANHVITSLDSTTYTWGWVINVQFDAESWAIFATDAPGGTNVQVEYKATVTHL
jgi:hypothetical protein